MHFDSFFRQFFGPSFPFQDRNFEDDAGTNSPPSSGMFGGPPSEFEQLDQMINSFLQETFANFPGFRESPVFQEPTSEHYKPSAGSLRDQMLKPGYQDPITKGGWESERSIKADQDLDDVVKSSGSLDVLLPKPRDDGMHYSTRSSMNYYHSSNGATETRTTSNDREGCHRELITKEFKGKKYVIEKRQCPGAAEQTTETLVNLNKEELSEFLKNWKTGNTTGINQDGFNFFGSLR